MTEQDFKARPVDVSKKWQTKVIDNEAEYRRFLKIVYERYGGVGLTFTDKPIFMSFRVAPWLVEQIGHEFQMRDSLDSDLDAVRRQVQGCNLFDMKIIRGLLPPGFGQGDKIGRR